MPNQDSLGFTARVPFRNEEGEIEYRPLYLPPDATDTIKGDVKLSDDYSSTDALRLNAREGMTAFTPQGAYTMYGVVQGALQTKLSKTDKEKQSVTSDVDFAGKISTSELTLNTPVDVSIGVGGGQKVTSKFDGHSKVEMTIGEIPADTLTGTISMDRLPQGALERLVKYVTLDAAIKAYTTAQEQDKPFQLGDSILITGTDPNRMFIAAGPDLAVEAGYVEYAAGTALKLGSDTIGSETQPIYLNSGSPVAITNVAVAHGGTGGSNVKEASANLKYTSLADRAVVPEADLNEIRTAGSYFDNGTVATSNLPGKDKFAYNLEVFENTDGTVRQQLRYYNDFNVWERIYSNKTDANLPALTNNWTSWSKAGGGSGGAEATSTTLGEVYASVNSSMPSFIPLGYVYSQKKEGLVISSIKDGVITTQHLADGAVTTDKLASGAVGGGSIFSDGTLNEGTLLSSVSFNCGSFNMYLVSFKLDSSRSAEISYTVNETKLVISPTSTETNHVTPPSPIGTNVKASHAFTWFQPKSTSARAALATLLPVQDECEEMEAEVAKLEQDWIDNPDETVAVDGNGVPVTIAAKKTALEAKKAELEKLREDYFSKLGDWKNEVQE